MTTVAVSLISPLAGTGTSQIRLFPRVKALVYFDTPHDQRGQDSRVAGTASSLRAFVELGRQPEFQVSIRTG